MIRRDLRLVFMLGVLTAMDFTHAVEDNKIEISDIAKEIVARSTTNSQVLSLNLTNLVILLVLKGLLFGAAMLGHQKGRSVENDEPLLTGPELMLLTAYLMADSKQSDYSCLHRVACQEPTKAKQYIAAAKILLKAGKLLDSVVPYDPKYEQLVDEMQDAVNFGVKYGSCGQKYLCLDQKNSE